MSPTLSVVVPHWPLDEEVDELLSACLASLPSDCENLCVPGTVTSPLVLEKPGIERGGFHGAFWVAPKDVLDRVGLLDERFVGAFYEDDDYRERLSSRRRADEADFVGACVEPPGRAHYVQAAR